MLTAVAAISTILLIIMAAAFAGLVWLANRTTTDTGPAGDITTVLATAELPVIIRPPWRTAPAAGSPLGDNGWPVPGAQPRCPDPTCNARRCRHHRDGDSHEQVGRPAYAAGRPLPRDGRHSTTVRIAHWARIDRLHQLRDRMGIAPAKILVLP